MGNYEFNLAQNYTMLYFMIHSKDFLKNCPSIARFSIMRDYSPSLVKKMTKSFPIISQSRPSESSPIKFLFRSHKVLIPSIAT